MVGIMLGGAVAAVCGVWQWADAARRQNPRHRIRRRGQIACVSGAGAMTLALTFMLTPQPWENAVLLAWAGGTAVTWWLNEWLSLV